MRSVARALLALSTLEACTLDVRGSGSARAFDNATQESEAADLAGLDPSPLPADAQVEPDEAEEDDVDEQADAAIDATASGLAPPAAPAAPTGPGKPSVPTKVVRDIDGATTQGEWDDASWSYQNTASNWGDDRNALRSIAAVLDDEFLWVRIEGVIELANAMVVYVDSVPGAGLAPNALTDRLGTVDDAISCGVSTPSAHAPDFAWGTRVTDGNGALIGPPSWRALSSASDLAWIDDKAAPSACVRDVCETRIARSAIDSKGPVYLFARLVNGTGDLLSNQGLPAQSGHTEHATDLMRLSYP